MKTIQTRPEFVTLVLLKTFESEQNPEKAYTRVRANLFTKPYRLWINRNYYEKDFFDDGDECDDVTGSVRRDASWSY